MSKRKGQRQRVEAEVPGDVLVEILYRLPINSLARFKLVNKEWNSSISSPRFFEDYNTRKLEGASHHLIIHNEPLRLATHRDDENYNGKTLGLYTVESRDLTSHDNEEIVMTPLRIPREIVYKDQYWVVTPKFLGSYNGLVGMLVLSDTDFNFTLWNPLTDKHVTCSVPRNSMSGGQNDMNNGLFGLCYDSSSDAYVAVVASKYEIPSPSELPPLFYSPRFKTKIHLVNFKTREFEAWNLRSFSEFEKTVATVVCGVPHWLKEVSESGFWLEKKVIIYFSLEKESFKEMEVPLELVGLEGKTMVGLGSLDGGSQLCVTLQFQDMTPFCLEVWVMKEYGNLESWTNMFAIQGVTITQSLRSNNRFVKSYNSVGVLGIMESGEYLIYVNCMDLWAYDPDTGSSRKIQIKKCSGSAFTVIVYEPSLISPPQLTPQVSVTSKCLIRDAFE